MVKKRASGIGSGCEWTDGEWFNELRGVGWTGRCWVDWEVLTALGGVGWANGEWLGGIGRGEESGKNGGVGMGGYK